MSDLALRTWTVARTRVGIGWQAAGIYLVFRAITAVMLVRASAEQVPVGGWTGPDPGYLDMTVLWDGSWYRRVALEGYPKVLPLAPDGPVDQNAWAFYPLFPMVSRVLMTITGLEFPVVASTLALVCGALAAAVMGRLLARRLSPRVALGGVAVWASFLSSPTFQLAYTESLAMLLLVLMLERLDLEEWLSAGLLAVVIGFTRPIATPLIGVMLCALWMRWRRRGRSAITRPEATQAVVALGLTVIAAVEWPMVAWAATGSRSAYSDTMGAWRASHEITPLKPWLWITEYLLRGTSAPHTYAPVALAVVVVALLVAVLGPWANGLGVVLRAWTLAYPAYLAVVLDPFTSVFRYLLPLFPLGVLIIGGGRRRGPGSLWWARLLVVVLIGVECQVLWIWNLLIFHPPSGYPP